MNATENRSAVPPLRARALSLQVVYWWLALMGALWTVAFYYAVVHFGHEFFRIWSDEDDRAIVTLIVVVPLTGLLVSFTGARSLRLGGHGWRPASTFALVGVWLVAVWGMVQMVSHGSRR
jgi:hypothetical protein